MVPYMNHMKYCNKCETEKPICEFRKNSSRKDGLQSQCAECSKTHNKSWYLLNKRYKIKRNRAQRKDKVSWLREYKKTLSCTRCSENDFRCLDFHHINDKSGDISVLIQSWSIERIKTEIAKCVILCANCHRKETFSYMINETKSI
jgi:DUF4097 and DUF4098 domain-containing protein YvlB